YINLDVPNNPARSGGRTMQVSLENDHVPAPASYFAYDLFGKGDIGVRPGMGLLIRDDRRGEQVARFGDSAHVFSTSANDKLAIYFENGMYRITRGTSNSQFVDASIALQSIYVHGCAGNDRILVSSFKEGDLIGLDGNAGDDILAPTTASKQVRMVLFGGAG